MRTRSFDANRKQFLPTLRERLGNFFFAFVKARRCLRNRVALDQNIFTAEFIVRIASLGRVAVRLHTVVKVKNLSGIADRVVDFFLRPDVKRAFGGLRVTGITDPGYKGAIGVFGGEEAAFL
jgi:hypothetical protein